MELKAYNTALEPLGVVDEIQSLIWHPKYWDVGVIKILVPLTENNSKLIKTGVILVKHYTEDVTDVEEINDTETWRRAAQITYVNISKDATGTEIIEAQGLFLSCWLSSRVIASQIVTTAKNYAIMERIVKENLGSLAAADRQLPAFEIVAATDLGGTAIEYTHNILADVGLAVHERAVAGKLGYDIFVDERQKKYAFMVYKGNDLTQGNSSENKPCIFSQEFDNIQEQEYTNSVENVKNVTYVAGQVEDDGTMQIVETGTATGLDRKEVYTDAADIQRTYKDGDTEVVIPLAKYLELLAQAGNDNLESYTETISFSSEIKTDANLIYRKDYDVGDRVTSIEKRWGLRIDTRITEVEEVSEQGKESINVTFGESLPELLDKIRKVR